jgi:hypothetical protein
MVGFPLGAFLETVRSGIENIVFAIVWGLIGYALLSLRGTVAATFTRELNFGELTFYELRGRRGRSLWPRPGHSYLAKALSAVTAPEALGFFGHAGYPPTAHLL